MRICSLYLKNFRKYEEALFHFEPGMNVIVGPNAQGKTTILEAIHCLMIGRSFRAGSHQDLFRTGASNMYIEALFEEHGVQQKLRIFAEGKERKIFYNDTPLGSLSQLLGLIRGVVLTPEDVDLIRGAPADRRQFLDILLAQTDPLYVHHLTRYKKAIKHRNQLLKEKKEETIDLWEEELSEAAGYITFARKEAIFLLRPLAADFYHYLAGSEESFVPHYRTQALECATQKEIKQAYLAAYRKQRKKELLFGHTMVGPHKDDIELIIEGRDARYFSSEGQKRSAIAAIRMGGWEHLKRQSKDMPLWMVDDIGVSLDYTRRRRLLELLSSAGQLFVTTTEEKIADSFGKRINFLRFSTELV